MQAEFVLYDCNDFDQLDCNKFTSVDQHGLFLERVSNDDDITYRTNVETPFILEKILLITTSEWTENERPDCVQFLDSCLEICGAGVQMRLATISKQS